MVAFTALGLAGCGNGGTDHLAVSIFSDNTVDADVTRDLATDTLSAPNSALTTGDVLAGIYFTPPSGASISDTRGFLEFPLGDLPLGATIHRAYLSIYLDDVTLSDPTKYAPFFLDLIDTNAFPPPIASSDFSSAYLLTQPVTIWSYYQQGYLEPTVTDLLREAQAQGLPSFRVRIGFDNDVYVSDPGSTRGLIRIYDGPDGRFAPLLQVYYD